MITKETQFSRGQFMRGIAGLGLLTLLPSETATGETGLPIDITKALGAMGAGGISLFDSRFSGVHPEAAKNTLETVLVDHYNRGIALTRDGLPWYMNPELLYGDGLSIHDMLRVVLPKDAPQPIGFARKSDGGIWTGTFQLTNLLTMRDGKFIENGSWLYYPELYDKYYIKLTPESYEVIYEAVNSVREHELVSARFDFAVKGLGVEWDCLTSPGSIVCSSIPYLADSYPDLEMSNRVYKANKLTFVKADSPPEIIREDISYLYQD